MSVKPLGPGALSTYGQFPRPAGARPGLKRQIVHRAQQALFLSGMARLFARLTNPQGALILYYHSIADDRLSAFIDPDNRLSAEQFESQLLYLKKHCNVISLEQLMDCLEGHQTLPKRAVLVTFDDGYLDNLTIAAPLLDKYQIPATLFLCSGYVERREAQWIDELYTAFSYRTKHRLELVGVGGPYDLAQKDQMLEAYGAIAGELLTCTQENRAQILHEVKSQLQPARAVPQLTLGWDDVRRLKERYPLFEIGLHTHDHLDLAALDKEEIEAELRRSQTEFEHELGSAARYFSYPYGRNSELARQCVAKAGFKCALATQPTALASRREDRFALPRFETSPSKLDLQLWMTGAFPHLSKRILGRVYD